MGETCKRCGAPIEMVITEKRRRFPVEPAPRDQATLVLLDPEIGTGFPERRVADVADFEMFGSVATHRRHVCSA